MSAEAHGDQKHLMSLELELQEVVATVYECWEQNSVFLDGQYFLLTTESSLQLPQNYFF